MRCNRRKMHTGFNVNLKPADIKTVSAGGAGDKKEFLPLFILKNTRKTTKGRV